MACLDLMQHGRQQWFHALFMADDAEHNGDGVLDSAVSAVELPRGFSADPAELITSPDFSFGLKYCFRATHVLPRSAGMKLLRIPAILAMIIGVGLRWSCRNTSPLA